MMEYHYPYARGFYPRILVVNLLSILYGITVPFYLIFALDFQWWSALLFDLFTLGLFHSLSFELFTIGKKRDIRFLEEYQVLIDNLLSLKRMELVEKGRNSRYGKASLYSRLGDQSHFVFITRRASFITVEYVSGPTIELENALEIDLQNMEFFSSYKKWNFRASSFEDQEYVFEEIVDYIQLVDPMLCK